jgi:hypothetical protein
MSVPPMTPANPDRKIVKRLEKLEAAFREFATASGTLGSATVSKGVMRFIEGGSIRLEDGGSVLLEDGGGVMVGDGGFITAVGGSIRAVDADTDAALAYFGKLLTAGGAEFGTGLMTSGSDADVFFWVAERTNGVRELNFGGNTARLDGSTSIILNTPSLELYGIASTSSAANVRLEVAGGKNVLQYVSSSLRYKDDPQDAVIEPREVLQMQGRTWVDKGLVDRLGETGDEVDVPRNVGFIAEELDALPSLRQFVDYDDEGRPDAIQYDRITVALLELAKFQQTQIDALTTRLNALDPPTPETEEVP